MTIEERTSNRQFTATCDEDQCGAAWGAAPMTRSEFRQELLESGWTLVDDDRVLCPVCTTTRTWTRL